MCDEVHVLNARTVCIGKLDRFLAQFSIWTGREKKEKKWEADDISGCSVYCLWCFLCGFVFCYYFPLRKVNIECGQLKMCKNYHLELYFNSHQISKTIKIKKRCLNRIEWIWFLCRLFCGCQFSHHLEKWNACIVISS